jgi:hypothetical protein
MRSSAWRLKSRRDHDPSSVYAASHRGGTSSGTIELSAANGQDQRALHCFVTAVAACKAASIHVSFINVDVVTNDVYAIDPGGTPAHCTVSDSQSTSVDIVSKSPVTTTRCRAASVHPTSATITCPGGGQPLVLLATFTYTPPRASCGSATVQYLGASTPLVRSGRGALACFATAARACKPAGLQLAETGAGWGLTSSSSSPATAPRAGAR